jgi:phage FluMu protein Com
METFYKEYRCPDCDKLLFKGLLIDSQVEIKCRRCRDLKILSGQAASQYLCLKEHCPNRVVFKQA